MKERPILFSAPMVRAILDGRKTQTRRIVKRPKAAPDTAICDPTGLVDPALNWWRDHQYDRVGWSQECPYGRTGDTLWVKEAFWKCTDTGRLEWYDADLDARHLAAENHTVRKMPSIHMPRALSRITLEITDVRVEQLNQISEKDAMAEGAPPVLVPPDGGSAPHVEGFRILWEEIHGCDAWDANPWVWAITFKRGLKREERKDV